MKVPQQVIRLGAVFAAAIGALVVARSLLVPETFGELGHYRAAAIDSITAHPKKYAGHQECGVCHDDLAAKRVAGNHRGVACEVCHGPQQAHVDAPLDVKPPAPRDRGFCPLCHAYNPSRPTGFPQIDPVAHNPLVPCITCHDPHAPVPPAVPQECSACHGQIARQKALSHHANLACGTCHQVPQQHKVTPRVTRATIPADRAFCGRCHAEGGVPGPAEAPRIDPAAHNPRYLCWQCHYPHDPRSQ